jgi:hypothetical protein
LSNKGREEAEAFLDMVLPQLKALHMAGLHRQGSPLHGSLSENIAELASDWIDEAVHGSSPKRNTLEEGRTQMQDQNDKMNGDHRFADLLEPISTACDLETDEARAVSDD